MSFFVMPAVDLKDGKCVRLVQGDPRYQTVELDNPLEVAKNWETLGARRLHVVDLDGALQGERKNEGILKAIRSTLEIPIQFGGGIRTIEDASGLLDLGIEKIILGTVALEEKELLERLNSTYGSKRLIVALDTKEGRVVTKGWVKDTGERAADVAKGFEGLVSECLFTNVDVEGKVEGANLEVIKEVVDSTSLGVIASGGISSVDDIRRVKSLGASGVVIGTALYKGKIDFKKALELEEK
jgi:phosphoribosylformimino-5-aminoimidazole carboxamide ribotide isomerase